MKKPLANETQTPPRMTEATADLTQVLTDFTADLAAIDDLGRLCAFVAQRAAALVAADEGAVYLQTRPLSVDDSPLQFTVPLRARDEVWGLLTVARHCPEGGEQAGPPAFSQHDQRLLTLLANVAAVAVAGIKRAQAVRRRNHWRDRALELLQETGRVMGSTLELVPLMRRIINVTVRALQAEAGMLALLGDDGRLVVRVVAGEMPPSMVNVQLETAQNIIGWVTRHGRSALVPDPSADPRTYLEHPAAEAGFVVRALLAAPLVSKGQTIGAVEVANKRCDAFDEADRHLLEALALSAAAAIENARLYERMQRQVLQQENIIRVGHAMSSAQGVDTVLQEVVEAALAVIPSAFTATVHLLDKEEGVLQLYCDAGRPLWDAMTAPFSIGQGIAGHVFATRRLVNVADVLADPRYVPGPGRTVYRSLLVAPLFVEDEPMGTLSVTGLDLNAFGRDDEQMIRALAAQAAVALRNARLLDSLRESQNRYQSLVENANALLVTTDASGVIIFAGGRWVEMTGYAAEEAVGLTYQHLCHPEDWPLLAEHVTKLLAAPGKVSDLRYRASHQDGTLRWHQISAVSTGGPDGQVERIYAVIHDVTNQVEAEQAIARHADQLAALNAIASFVSRSLDIDDTVQGGLQELMSALAVDAAGLALLDPHQERLVPQTVIGLSSQFLDCVVSLLSADRSPVLRARQALLMPDLMAAPHLAPGLPDLIERAGVRTLAAVPVIAEDNPIGVLFVGAHCPDAISASALDLLMTVGQQFGVALHNAQLYAQAEERAAQLEIAYRQLQDLAHRKSQFVQNVSHELRTPLTFVRGYLELLLSGELGALPDEQRGILEIIDVKSQHLVALVNDITGLLDVELRPADVEPVDLVEVVGGSITARRERARAAGVVLEAEWSAVPAVVNGSYYRLTQVFNHLLDNAIKFSPHGGHVGVRIWRENGNVLVQVTDQGIGVSPDEQERIFDLFYQVDGSTARRFGGTGLGLAIVKETIEAHGGTVRVESSGAEGEGTVFTVILPVALES